VATPISECDACGAELTNGEQSRVNVEAMKKIELKAKLHATNNRDLTPINCMPAQRPDVRFV
jgi:hypothetical protein